MRAFMVISWNTAPRWISHFLAAPRSAKFSSACVRVTNLRSEAAAWSTSLRAEVACPLLDAT